MTRTVGIYLTEAGIIFHSVMIGITLGVTSESFNTLLAALCFHQFFEGFALASAAVDAALGTAKCIIMAVAYSVTTPVGIAIGEHELGFDDEGCLVASGYRVPP